MSDWEEDRMNRQRENGGLTLGSVGRPGTFCDGGGRTLDRSIRVSCEGHR